MVINFVLPDNGHLLLSLYLYITVSWYSEQKTSPLRIIYYNGNTIYFYSVSTKLIKIAIADDCTFLRTLTAFTDAHH